MAKPIKDRFSRIRGIISYTRLQKSRIAIVGAGTMSQGPAEQFARHGIATKRPGELIIIDGDIVSESNLIYGYKVDQVGMLKTTALRRNLLEINPDMNITCIEEMLTTHHLQSLARLAGNLDLLCLFADSPELMMKVDDFCAETCPQIMAQFGRRCDTAEIGFSLPGKGIPLRSSFGNRTRHRIDAPSALGCDTAWVSLFVASVCMGILLRDSKSSPMFPPCRPEAPLYVLGLRRRWVFSRQPKHIVRSAISVRAARKTV